MRSSGGAAPSVDIALHRSEEHTSELQSRLHLVCRLLLEKKNFAVKHHTDRKVLVDPRVQAIAHALGPYSQARIFLLSLTTQRPRDICVGCLQLEVVDEVG